MLTMKNFTDETELTLKNTITEEFITASKIIFADVAKKTDINSLSLNERMSIGDRAFVAECNRVYYIGDLKKIAIAADTKANNGEGLTEDEKHSITLYNGYFNLVSTLYPIAAAYQTALNPNAKNINLIHTFALMTAKEKAYTIYEKNIKECLAMNANAKEDAEKAAKFDATKAETFVGTVDKVTEDVACKLVDAV